MKESLSPGIEHEFAFRVPESKTVPNLYPESEEFQAMPQVFATGFFVGLIEWACIRAVNPHLDWPAEQTVGTHVDVSHEAATPPGLEASVRVRLMGVEGRRLSFEVEASDGVDIIGRGRHERAVIDAQRFENNVARKSGEKRDEKVLRHSSQHSSPILPDRPAPLRPALLTPWSHLGPAALPG